MSYGFNDGFKLKFDMEVTWLLVFSNSGGISISVKVCRILNHSVKEEAGRKLYFAMVWCRNSAYSCLFTESWQK